MSITAIVTIINFLKKYWPFITIGAVVIAFGIFLTVFSIKLRSANKKIEKLEQEKIELEMTNRVLYSEIEKTEKDHITKTNFINSDTSIENMDPNRLPDDFIQSLNDTFKDYNFNLSNNTLSNNSRRN